MRVITTFFSLESRLLTQRNLKVGAICNSIPAPIREVITTYREWQGAHEGANRIQLIEPSAPMPKATRRNQRVNVSLTLHLDNTVSQI